MSPGTTEARVLLLGCGILRKEVQHLVAARGWPVDTVFLDSSLHCDLKQLQARLQSALARYPNREVVIFYGTCHPLMDAMLESAHTFRTVGQNCVEILLGKELFDRELANGAFFLLEEWAKRWEQITIKTFGTMNLQVIRDIYHGDRKYLLALRTPCSDDFTAEAEAAAEIVQLPVRWMDVSLDLLEIVLERAIQRKLEELA